MLEAHLSKNTFLVGERLTLADVMLAAYTKFAVTVTLDPAARKRLPAVMRHFETVVHHPGLKGELGENVEYCEKALTFVPPPKEN